MASLVQSSATRWPQEDPRLVAVVLLLMSSSGGLEFWAESGRGRAGEALGAGWGRGLGKETEPLEGMWWFAVSHSMASLAAYCFASFLREKMALGSPMGEGRSPSITRQVKRFKPGLDSS